MEPTINWTVGCDNSLRQKNGKSGLKISK